jgi:hypothetical protein
VGLISCTALLRGAVLSVELPGEAKRLRAPVLARVARVVQQDAQHWRAGAVLALPLAEDEVWAVLAVAHAEDAKAATPEAANPGPAGKAWFDPFQFGAVGERRISARRKGGSVGVSVSTLWGRREPLRGYVLNRSLGGLALHLPKALPSRAGLMLRAEHAPLRVTDVHVEVRHCTRAGNGWLIGVSFLSTPPADVLLTFG